MIIKYLIKSHGIINTKTQIEFKCDQCKAKYSMVNRNYLSMKSSPYYIKDYCSKCWRKVLNNRPEYKKNMSKAINKMYADRPEIRDKKRKSMMGKNAGDSNGMKQKEARMKVSKTRKKMFKDNPELKKLYSEKIKKAWADGKFDGVRVGRCKWYDYKHSNGNIYKVQGTWELAFIKWLDKSKMEFTCHRGRIPYIIDDTQRNYYPDFWVNIWDCFVDVKCKHFYNEKKFNAIRSSNPDKEIRILFKKDLHKLGVKL